MNETKKEAKTFETKSKKSCQNKITNIKELQITNMYWITLLFDFKSQGIKVFLNGKRYYFNKR